jgi:radical SAM superfamily enzyme YgiQ (UPF0313 family)
MTVKLSFADLTHTGQTVIANVFPLGISMVAAYAKQELDKEIDVEIFRYPEDFNHYLEKEIPAIAAFSCFSWNINLNCEFARCIKERSPETIIIFGGVNFPSLDDEQKAFLAARPVIDFYVENDGELPFVELYKSLKAVDFDCEKLKQARTAVPSTCYVVDDELVKGEMMERIVDLDSIPSIYTTGLSDKFFDGVLSPMIETARGCPYSCTFCVDGHRYSNKTRRFSQERIYADLDYIAERSTVNEFIVSDLNFGMFKEDVETADYLAKLKKKCGFPKYLVQSSAKNNKTNIIKISEIMGGGVAPAASIQTTDQEVLKLAKRKNLPLKDLAELAATKESDDASFLAEIILNLPGDSKKAHFKTIDDMLDAGATLFRSYQFTLLEGTEAASQASREKFELKTKFRVLPRCFGKYTIMGDGVIVGETEEISVGSTSMTYEDYRDSRDLDLTMEIFINDALFYEFLQFLGFFGVSRSEFVRGVHALAIKGNHDLAQCYAEFRQEEERNLWEGTEEVQAFIHKPGAIDKYIEGTYGFNEVHKYRTRALFSHMDVLHQIVFDVAKSLIGERIEEENAETYLSELKELSLMRKSDFLDHDKTFQKNFSFDFIELGTKNYTVNPLENYLSEGVWLEVAHSNDQRKLIDGWVGQYDRDRTPSGLARLLSRSQISAMYRQPREMEGAPAASTQESTDQRPRA